MAITDLASTDLVVRVANTEPNLTSANTFATYAEAEAEIRIRMDRDLWTRLPEDLHIRAMVSAYRDMLRLPWDRRWSSQDRDNEAAEIFGSSRLPPVDDSEFLISAKRAQIAQVMFILAGTQVRDMARDGIRIQKNLSGAEIEITGYRGPVCAEALEIMARWIDLQPRMRRMR